MFGSMGTSANNTCYGAIVAVDGDVQTYTIQLDCKNNQVTTSACAYIRIDGKLMDGYTAEDVIITINEEIV
jgi:hypothetical protein